MKCFILILVMYSGQLLAKDYSAESFLKAIIKNHLKFKIIKGELSESIAKINSVEGIYDVLLKSSIDTSRDNSEQTLSQTPRNTRQIKGAISASKKFEYGVNATALFKNTRTQYDFMGSHLSRNKSEIGVGLDVSLLKNRYGVNDRSSNKIRNVKRKLLNLSYGKKISYLSLEIISSFYMWIGVTESLKINKEVLQSAKHLLKLAVKRSNRGVQNNREIFIHNSNISEIESRILDLKKSLYEVKSEINYLSGDINSKYKFDNVKNNNAFEKYINPTILKKIEGLSHLKTIDIARKELSISKEEVSVSKNSLLPELNLRFNVNSIGNKESLSDSFNDSRRMNKLQLSVGLNLEIPIGNTSAHNSHISSISRLNINRAALKDKKKNMNKSLLIMTNNIFIGSNKIKNASKHMLNEKKKYRNEMKEYRLGARSSVNLISFQNDYLNSRLELLKNRISYMMAINTYLNETDNLLGYYSIELEKVI